MNKQDRITELTEQLNELQLPNMASSLESICSTGRFDSLDNLSLLEEMVGSEYEAKTSLKFQNRLKRAHLSGGPQTIDRCKDSAERAYLPPDITSTLASLDFIREGLHPRSVRQRKVLPGQGAWYSGLPEIPHKLSPL